MKKNDVITMPDVQVDTLVSVLGDVAAGRPVDPAKLVSAMPAAGVLQGLLDGNDTGMTIITGTRKENDT